MVSVVTLQITAPAECAKIFKSEPANLVGRHNIDVKIYQVRMIGAVTLGSAYPVGIMTYVAGRPRLQVLLMFLEGNIA